MGFPATEGADVKASGFQRRDDRQIVERRIMGDGNQRGVGIERPLCQGCSRAAGDQIDIGKTFRRREISARIDDGEIEAGKLGHYRERLADAHSPDHDDARRRNMDLDKQAAALDVDGG